MNDSPFGSGGGSGWGGGVDSEGDILTISDTRFQGNQATGGDAGVGGGPHTTIPEAGQGGALNYFGARVGGATFAGTVAVSDSQFVGNQALAGYGEGGDGATASGGGLYVDGL